MNNAIYLRRRRKVWLAAGSGHQPQNVVAALLKNIEPLGWTLSPALIEQVGKLSREELELFYTELVSGLRALTGAHREWKPMYPNFPRQVMDMPEGLLYFNAIWHYLTNELPNYVKRERLPLLDETKLQLVEAGTEEEFEGICTALAAAKTAPSQQDREDLAWFVNHSGNDIFKLLPEEIPSRETKAFLAAALLRTETEAEAWLAAQIKTATDVLRVTAALCNGDVSLASPTKWTPLTRRQRRLLLSLLEKAPNLTEDMLRWKKRWIRIGERLHPGEHKSKYPQAFKAFTALRNDHPIATFNSQLEAALAEKDTAGAISLLSTRPGDFARRLDHVLRLSSADTPQVLDTLAPTLGSVSTPVLLQLWTHFRHRDKPKEIRVFFPKGNVAKAQAIPDTLPALTPEAITAVTSLVRDTLLQRFARLAPLGRCYLNEELKKYPVPFATRSASKTLRTLPRGSRLPLPDANILRFFLWWKNGRERTDIDLSAAFYGTGFVYRDVVSYYNLKNYGGYHSGDIVDAPEGAAEFIDLNRELLREKGIRWIVMSINSYTSQPYCDLPECFAGWMARSDANSGEIFEPKTVQDRIDLAADTRICIPLLIDLEEGEAIWTDLALTNYPSWNNVDNNLSGITATLKAMTSLQKTTLYDLFDLHVQSRGQRVDTAAEADTVFSVEEGITPFNIETITSQFL